MNNVFEEAFRHASGSLLACPLQRRGGRGTSRLDRRFESQPRSESRNDERRKKMRYALLWLLGIPIPVLIVLWLLFGR
jgi:hypothetical protein